MARFLAIDWEQDQLHVVQASTVRGGVKVEQALTWALPEPLTAIAGEALGKKLRDALKEANVTPAPVLVCVGRERVILKELRYPAVPANEEPAIVRFQAAKELTESPEDSVIDYTHMGDSTGQGERHALAVIVRKEVVNSLQALCRGLGVKLLAMTPRPAAVAGALLRSRQGEVKLGAVEALLTIGPRWADLGIFRGQSLLFARSLGVGPTMASEVKRSVAVFNAGSDAAVQSVFVASDEGENALCARLEEALKLPVHFMDAFLPGDAVQVDKARRSRFTGAIGLLHRWSDKPELPINFVAPKEPKAVENPRRRQKVLAVVVAAVVAVFLLIFGNMVLADKKDQIVNLTQLKTQREDQLKGMAQERADITGIKDWDNSMVSWLNEIFDLTARFPSARGFRVVSLTASPNPSKKGKERIVASMSITGTAEKEVTVSTVDKNGKAKTERKLGRDLATELVATMNRAGLQAQLQKFDIPSQQGEQSKFTIKVDLIHQTPDSYTAKLVIPPRLQADPADSQQTDTPRAKGGRGGAGDGDGNGNGNDNGNDDDNGNANGNGDNDQ